MSSFLNLPAELLYQVFDYIDEGVDLFATLSAFRTKHGQSTIELVMRDREFHFPYQYLFQNCYLTARDLEWNDYVILRSILRITKEGACGRYCDTLTVASLRNLVRNGLKLEDISRACREKIFQLLTSRYYSKVIHYLLTEDTSKNFLEHTVDFSGLHYGPFCGTLCHACLHADLSVVQWLSHQVPNCIEDDALCNNLLCSTVSSGSLQLLKYLVGLGVKECMFLYAKEDWMSKGTGFFRLYDLCIQKNHDDIFDFLLQIPNLEEAPLEARLNFLVFITSRVHQIEKTRRVIKAFSIKRCDLLPSERNGVLERIYLFGNMNALRYIIREFCIEWQDVHNNRDLSRIIKRLQNQAENVYDN